MKINSEPYLNLKNVLPITEGNTSHVHGISGVENEIKNLDQSHIRAQSYPEFMKSPMMDKGSLLKEV